MVRSVFGGNTHAFVDTFDAAYAIHCDMEKMLQQHIPLNIVTDSKSILKVILQSCNTTKKRLMILYTSATLIIFVGSIQKEAWQTDWQN